MDCSLLLPSSSSLTPPHTSHLPLPCAFFFSPCMPHLCPSFFMPAFSPAGMEFSLHGRDCLYGLTISPLPSPTIPPLLYPHLPPFSPLSSLLPPLHLNTFCTHLHFFLCLPLPACMPVYPVKEEKRRQETDRTGRQAVETDACGEREYIFIHHPA